MYAERSLTQQHRFDDDDQQEQKPGVHWRGQSPGCTRLHVHQAVQTIQLHSIAEETDEPFNGS
jgi:hypothetical protein